jgi:nicotinate-nucleotide adenylyltransferase
MKIGLFFGSFNPIHNGHLIISTYVTNFVANKVWFVVSPQNPFKKNSELLNITDRILLVKSAIKNDNQLKVSDVELKLPIPSYTINTLAYLKKIYPKHDFFIIMGSDNFLSISKWKAPDLLLKDYKFIIYQRPGFLIDNKNFPNNIRIINAPLINISSTEIRELIKTKKSVRYIVPDAVIKIIEKNKFYSKDN